MGGPRPDAIDGAELLDPLQPPELRCGDQVQLQVAEGDQLVQTVADGALWRAVGEQRLARRRVFPERGGRLWRGGRSRGERAGGGRLARAGAAGLAGALARRLGCCHNVAIVAPDTHERLLPQETPSSDRIKQMYYTLDALASPRPCYSLGRRGPSATTGAWYHGEHGQ